MKFKTVVLAIATVLTLAQSAEANHCQAFDDVQTVGEQLVDNIKATTVTQALAGYNVDTLLKKQERYMAALAYNEVIKDKQGCQNYKSTKTLAEMTTAETALALRTILGYDEMLHN